MIEVPMFVWEVGQGRGERSRFVEAERWEVVEEGSGEYPNRYYQFFTGGDLVASFDAADWDFVVRVDAAVAVEEVGATEEESAEQGQEWDGVSPYGEEILWGQTQIFFFESCNVVLPLG